MEIYQGAIERKFAVNNSTRTLEGYGAVFSNVDSYGDVIRPGAFAKSLAAHIAAGTAPAMLFNHRAIDLPIGVWTSLEEDANGLKMEGSFLDTTAGTDAYKCVKAGAISGLSIGFIVTAFDVERDGDVLRRFITEVDLIEVSVVNFPANDLARVESVKMIANATSADEAETALIEVVEPVAPDTAPTEDAEAKYKKTVIDAVNKLILEIKMEKYVR